MLWDYEFRKSSIRSTQECLLTCWGWLKRSEEQGEGVSRSGNHKSLCPLSPKGHSDFFVATSESFYLSRTIESLHLMKLNIIKRDANSNARRRQNLPPSPKKRKKPQKNQTNSQATGLTFEPWCEEHHGTGMISFYLGRVNRKKKRCCDFGMPWRS